MHCCKNSLAAGLLVVLAGASSSAIAQSADMPARGPIPFTSYDKDDNGLVSEDEFNAARAERMAARSTAGRPLRGAANAPSFSGFDTDGDGQLTREELVMGQRARLGNRPGMGMRQGPGMDRNMPAFWDYDLDGNGTISAAEFQDARSRKISARAQQAYQMRNLANAPAFADVDTDGDGAIDADEFAAHQARHRRQRSD